MRARLRPAALMLAVCRGWRRAARSLLASKPPPRPSADTLFHQETVSSARSRTARDKTGREPPIRNIACCAAAVILFVSGAFSVRADEAPVMPPQGSALLLELIGDGVQIYACEAKDIGFEWVFKAPAANLFGRQGRQIGTHFGGPTWKISDGSTVVGEVIARADAPESDAIPWLLLRAKSHEGSGPLAAAAYIRRAQTKGGVAPKTGCDASHLSEQARMRYSSIYQFFSTAR